MTRQTLWWVEVEGGKHDKEDGVSKGALPHMRSARSCAMAAGEGTTTRGGSLPEATGTMEASRVRIS